MFDRRNFLRFVGPLPLALSQASLIGTLSACVQDKKFKGIAPSSKDAVVLAKGLDYKVLIQWGDSINRSEVFGYNNDYLDWHMVGNNPNDLIMWINHEYVNPIFVSGLLRTKKNIDIERSLVGGSLIRVKKIDEEWKFMANDSYNRGVRGTTLIPFANGVKIQGKGVAEGTLANCAGGKTPWGTFLTCEENYDQFYGEREESGEIKDPILAWNKFYPNPPEHYGWVVEVDPFTGRAQKHTNLGRFAHECATCVTDKNGNVVVYSGDDKNDEHLYKFVSDSSNSFSAGTLYVANIEKGKWIPLTLDHPELKKKFKDQLEINTYCRKAAKLVGATPLDRPEDIEVSPINGDIFIALTNNKPAKRPHGSILKISEKGGYSATKFKSKTLISGGNQSGFSCPDNLCFDQNGNLWITTDISGSSIGKAPYKKFKNNGLFVIPVSGKNAGEAIQVASAPIDAEFTGPKFSPDGKSLFLSVQHPGEKTVLRSAPTSRWPTGKTPRPAVIVISKIDEVLS